MSTSTRGLVASETRASAEAGAALLAAGGNAVDAAVAAALAETVVSPHNAGIGGFAGCMMIHQASPPRTVAVRFDTVAPAAATPDMFVGKRAEHRAGALSVGVPGVLRGLELAVTEFGRRPWREVVAPAHRLAADGFPIGAISAARITEYRRTLADHPATAAMLMPEGRPPAPGEHVRFPDLAKSLAQIGAEGANAFYRGDLGDRTVRHLQAHGGVLTGADLATYCATLETPLAFTRATDQFLTPALPGGGITVLQCLQALRHLPPPAAARPCDDPAYLHHVIQVMKLAWRDRLTHMADPACMATNPAAFLDDARARQHAEAILNDDVPENFSVPPDFTCTSHVTAADAAGNFAAVTFTHGFAFGSMVTPPGTGIILGHGMARFDGEPGRPNSVAPGKKALHNMAPLIVLRAGAPFAALGWTGGRRIPNVVLQAVENLTRFDLGLNEALGMPNLHTEGAEPIRMERGIPDSTQAALRSEGHSLTALETVIGFGAAVRRNPQNGVLEAATDPRRPEACVAEG